MVRYRYLYLLSTLQGDTHEKNKENKKNHPKSPSLMAHLEQLDDPRMERTRLHHLLDILVIALCTLLCGGESYNDMEDFGKAKEDWFKNFLE